PRTSRRRGGPGTVLTENPQLDGNNGALMSTTITETAPAAPAPAGTADASAVEVRRPLLWLAAILVLALGLRVWHPAVHLISPLTVEEFGTAYAVLERSHAQGFTPSAADPLRPVAGLEAVRERSVLPYGIENPVPLYNYLVYGVVQVLPAAEWSLRLLSLLAGLGCVVVMYFLCRPLGSLVALVAALLVALDPVQRSVSALAQPYA